MIKMFKTTIIFTIITFLFLDNSFCQELRDAKADFYKSSKEFVNEIDSIIARQRTLKKIDLEESFEGRVENIEVLEESNRKLSIESFENYLREYPNSDHVPDVLYRLGKLYYEDASQKLIRDTESYEKEYQKFIRGEVQVLPPEPNIDYSLAVGVLTKLINNYKDYRYRDDAMYLLGYAYFEEGQMGKAVPVFRQIINEFPNSERLPEIYTRLGENYFDMDDFDTAISYYSMVLNYPDSVYYENVLYKLGWIYYSRGKINESADFFVTLIDSIDKKHGYDYSNTFKTEAKNYIAVGFSESGNGIKDAYSFFNNVGGKNYEYEIMTKICELYIMSDRVKEARSSVSFVLSKYPDHPENPVLQDKLISDLRKYDSYADMNQEREKMITLFGDGSLWRARNIENLKAVMTADSLIEKQLISVAMYHQEKGDQTGKRSEYIAAAKLYYDFLKKHPSDPLMIGARYNYAQVLFNLRDYGGAANEYTAVRNYSTDDQYKEKSSFGVVSALQAKLKSTDKKYYTKEIKPLLSKSGDLILANNLGELEKSLVDSCNKYEELNPTGYRLDEVSYMKSEVYFRNNRFDDAVVGYKNIVNKYPNSKFYGDSIRNLISIYNYKKDYKEVEYWSNKLLSSKNIATSSYNSEEIKSLMTGSVFKSAQKLESEGKSVAAADEYVRLAKQYPKSEYSDAALYNAGVIYEKTGKYKSASSVYGTMLSKYPRSKYSADAMFRLAVSLEQDLNFNKALYYYELLIKKHPASKYVSDSHYNSYRIRRSKDEYVKAAEHLVVYSASRTNIRERSNALMQAAWLYEKSKKDKNAISIYSSYAERNKTDLDGVMESYVKTARIYEKAGNISQAMTFYNKAINLFKSSKGINDTVASDYNAEAKFKVLNKTFNEYLSIKINDYDYSKLKSTYDKKERLLNKLTDDYLGVVKLGVTEWSLASLYMIGLGFDRFAEFLYGIPVPKEINTVELKREYDNQIRTQALPYEDKAVENYEKTISESARLKTVNVWTKYAYRRLKYLRPTQYGEKKETIYVNSPSLDIQDYGFVGR